MFLIFDTETTGVPKNYNAPLTDFDNWPRVVQIAWQLHDEDGKLLSHRNLIIRPDGFTIPFNAEKIHGISTQRALDEGLPLKDVLEILLTDMEHAQYIAGHNISFDTNVTGCEFLRAGFEAPFERKKVLDTMSLSTDFCAIPGGRGGRFKWPSLTELHEKLFGQPFGDAHDAAYDVEATTRCFFGLIEHRVIPIPEIAQVDRIQYEAPVLDASNFKAREQQKASETQQEHVTPSDFYPGFVHLHVHSQYSLLQSTSDLGSMVKKAKEFGTEEFPAAIALTDHANMMGAFQFVNDAWKKEVKAIVGCEFNICADMRDKSKQDNGYQIPIIAKSRKGYQNLTKLSSMAFTDGFFYVPRIDKATLLEYAEDLIVLSGGIFGEVGGRLLEEGEAKAEEAFRWWHETFGDRFYAELNRHGLDEEEYMNRFVLSMCEKYQVDYVAANSAYYIERNDSIAQDTLVCIKEGESLSTPKKYTNKRSRDHRWGLPNDQYYLKSPEEMSRIFADLPEALTNTRKIADQCEAYKLTRDVLLPKFDIPQEFQDPQDAEDGGKRGENNYLRHLTYVGAEKRYGELSEEIRQRLDFELATIANTGYPGYFLIVQDFCNKARELGVSVGPGRGSAAGSAVAYCTGITNVDPIKYQLLFERFLNPERVSLPDIDIDFDDAGRDLVIQYVRDKYGANMVSQIITYGTMKGKSAIRDAGRVMGLPLPDTDKIAKCMPDNAELSNILNWDEKKLGNELSGEDFANAKVLRMKANEHGPEGEVIRLAASIEGSVRNTGIHACGVIITPDVITNYVPVATAKDSDMWCTQFDNSVVESAGLLKMDFLGLKTLTLIKDTIRIIHERHGIDIDIERIPIDDGLTYQLFQRGHTSGIFQYESDGMQKYMKELKPTVFEDLIAMNALYRPGPLEYIPDFIKRKNGLQAITYDLPEMEEFLKDTYGITVYQEQVMLLSQKLANFSKGEADVLRKAMGKKQKDVLDKMKGKFMEGAKSNGHPEDKLEKIWTDWEAFASYAFNKSHSTCYAWIAYQTAYLKAHYPAEYMAAVLSNNMDNLKTVTQYMQECKKQNIVVLGPDVNESMALFSVNYKGEIRFGLAAIKGVGEPAVKAIIEERKNGGYKSMYDFFARMDSRAANRRTLENLVLAGALDSFRYDRSVYFAPDAKHGTFIEVMSQYAKAYRESNNSAQGSLFGDAEMTIQEPPIPKTEAWDTMTRLNKEKEVVGMYISAHPLDDFLPEIDAFCDGRGLSALGNLPAIKGQDLRLAVIITSFIERTSQKTNKPYCIFTAEDFETSHEFRIFGEDYLKFRTFLSAGDKVMLQGNVQSYKYAQNPGDLEFKITRIEPLFKIRDLYAHFLDITIPLQRLNDELIERIANTIQNGQGKAKVRMKIQTPNGDLNLPSNVFNRVSVDPEALQALQTISEINVSLAEK